ncbi:MAG TPA: response regulator transcription factor [Phycisphaerae bacterium]|nr:response regulator transcription factor [Phycisphaerae bacterium]
MQREATVFVVDDDEAARVMLQFLLGSVGLGSEGFTSAQKFLDHYDPDRPGCLLLDVRMPGMSGLELQSRLACQGSKLPIILLTGHADVPMAVHAVRAGAFDFLEKPTNDQVLLDRVQQAIALDRTQRLHQAAYDGIIRRLASLTAKEREVMDRVVAGKANRQIAAELGVSVKAIEARRANVMSKMEAQSVADLVRMTIAASAPEDPQAD